MSKEAMTLALKRAFQLGQDYWYQADHEFVSQNKKSDETRAKFEQLIDDTCQALAKQEKGEHKESVRLECVVCKTVYEDGVPPQVAKQEQGEPVLWAAKESMFMWGNSDESGHPYHIICKGKKVKSHQIPLYTTPQPAQKPWVRLTDEDCQKIVQNFCLNVGDWTQNGKSVAIAIEAKLKEKNT